jgi:hypothetical protein
MIIKVEYPELVAAILELADAMRTGQVTQSVEKPKAKAAKAEKPAAEAPVVETPAPKASKEVTLEEVRARLGELSSDGKKDEIKQLFSEFGVSKLTELKAEHYSELLAAAEAL